MIGAGVDLFTQFINFSFLLLNFVLKSPFKTVWLVWQLKKSQQRSLALWRQLNQDSFYSFFLQDVNVELSIFVLYFWQCPCCILHDDMNQMLLHGLLWFIQRHHIPINMLASRQIWVDFFIFCRWRRSSQVIPNSTLCSWLRWVSNK